MSADNCSIVGAIPAPLLIESVSQFRFSSIQQHIRARLTTSTSSTCSDSCYCAHCHDILANLAANQKDTRLILNRELAFCDDANRGLGLRGKQDSPPLESVNNKQMVKNS